MRLVKRIVTVLFILSCLCLEAQSIHQLEGIDSNYGHLPFDANEVISRVSQQRIPENREGEFLIDTNVVYVPDPDGQYFPAIAFNGTNYLVVWEDGYYISDLTDIRGTRVSIDGTVLDPAGILISTTPAAQKRYPCVCTCDSNFFVAWQEIGNGWDIYGSRMSHDGVVLDTLGIAISTADDFQRYPSVAFDGSNYFVVWDDERNGFGDSLDIYGARISQDGTVLDTTGIRITTSFIQAFPSVAFDGINYFVVWVDERNYADIYGARVNQSGIVLDTAGIAISTIETLSLNPCVVFNDTNYLVVWENYINSNDNDIYGARVSPDGIVLDTNGIMISNANAWQQYPCIAFDGTNCLVAWADLRDGAWDIYGARVSQTGIVLDPFGIPISTSYFYQKFPAIVFGDTNYLVVWEDQRSVYNSHIYSTQVSQNGTVLDTMGEIISTIGNEQLSPSVSFDGQNYLIAWEDLRGSLDYDIYSARVNQSGTVLDTISIPISTATNKQIHTAITFDGTNFLAVWEDHRSGVNIYGSRVDPDGTVLDTLGIAISTAANNQVRPSISFDNTNYFVVWEDCRNVSYYDIYGARVMQSGAVLDTQGIAISTAVNNQRNPSISFDGTHYLVVWEDYRGDAAIYGARVGTDGIVLDTTGIPISTANHVQKGPAIAFDGQNYLVVWQDSRNLGWDIYGTLVNQDGMVLDTIGIAISTAPFYQMEPAVTFDGLNYIVAWHVEYSASNYHIFGAKLNREGEVIDSFVVSDQPGNQTSPALAHGQENQILITYSGFIDSINGRPANTMRIWGKFYPFTGLAEDAGFRIQDARYGITIYPNPFRQKTKITFNIGHEAKNVELKIYDITGRLVKIFLVPSSYSLVPSVFWDGTDNLGRRLASGIYFCRLATDEIDVTEKIILLR